MGIVGKTKRYWNVFYQSDFIRWIIDHGLTIYFFLLTATVIWCLAWVVNLGTTNRDLIDTINNERTARLELSRDTALQLCQQDNNQLLRTYKQDKQFWEEVKRSQLESFQTARQLDIPGYSEEEIRRAEENAKDLMMRIKPEIPIFKNCRELPLISGEDEIKTGEDNNGS